MYFARYTITRGSELSLAKAGKSSSFQLRKTNRLVFKTVISFSSRLLGLRGFFFELLKQIFFHYRKEKESRFGLFNLFE
ncbi:MAG: hypothetical protein EBZ47_10345 [Chlamydiae bacterium]|nr:hypothetical protein [Chlamydiota bacterium]